MRSEDLTFRRYVLSGAHTPIAALLCVVGAVGIYGGLRLLGMADGRFTHESALRIAGVTSVVASAAYWIRGAISAYAHLRLSRRLQRRLEEQWAEVRKAEEKPNQ